MGIIFLPYLVVILHLGRINTLAGVTPCLSSSMRTFPVNAGSELVTQALSKFDSMMMFMDSGVTKTTLDGVPIFKVVSVFTSGSRIKLIDLVLKGPINFFSALMHRGWARTR